MIALQADEFELERFIGEFDAGFGVADHATDETLTLLDDAPHVLLQHLEILGCEGLGGEVVVEAVGDRRADAQLGVGAQILQCLRGHVGGGVAQDVQPVLRGEEDRFHFIAFGQFAR